MSSPEAERFSRLSAIRRVVTPTELEEELTNLEAAQTDPKEKLSDSEEILLSPLENLLSTAQELINSSEFKPKRGVLDPLVYALEGIRSTIFERRIKAGYEANELLRKMYTRMESPVIKTSRKTRQPSGRSQNTQRSRPNPLPGALRDVEELYLSSKEPLIVRANQIVISSKQNDSRIGAELALVIDEKTKGALVLQAQRGVLMDAEMRMVAGRKLRKITEGPTDVLLLPFLRAPLMEKFQQETFIKLLSTELPVTNIEIGPVEWKLNTVSPSQD